MYYIKEQDVEGLNLPGRLWKKLIAPDEGDCQNMTTKTQKYILYLRALVTYWPNCYSITTFFT